MTQNNLLLSKIRESAGLRLCMLFGLMFFLLIISSIITEFLRSSDTIGERNGLLLSSAIQSILVFVIPALCCGYFSSNRPYKWLEIDDKITIRNIVGIVIVFIISLPAMNQLIDWNENIAFPESISGLETTLRQWEETGKQTTEILLNTSGFSQVITGILIIGVLTGLSEELFFRGALQKIFTETSLRAIGAIWIGAIIFSAFHFQFFGFFPRMIMGAFFGYLLYWTGSIWSSIFAHALNNSMVVVISSYFPETNGEKGLIETIGLTSSGVPWMAVISCCLTIVFLILFKNYFFYNKKNN